jgi:hypothetical protein
MRYFSRGRFWVVVILLLSIGAMVCFFLDVRAPRVGVVFLPLPAPEQPAALWRRITGRWLGWLEFHLFGPAKPVILKASFLEFKKPLMPVDPLFSDLPALASRFADTNGIQAWILSDVEMSALRQRLAQTPGAEVVSNPRVQTASGIQADFWVGETIAINGTNQNAGLAWTCTPRVRREGNELTAVFVYTEAVTNLPETTGAAPVANAISFQTNLAVAARMQMPKGGGAFLLKTGSDVSRGKTTGLLISTE